MSGCFLHIVIDGRGWATYLQQVSRIILLANMTEKLLSVKNDALKNNQVAPEASFEGE